MSWQCTTCHEDNVSGDRYCRFCASDRPSTGRGKSGTAAGITVADFPDSDDKLFDSEPSDDDHEPNELSKGELGWKKSSSSKRPRAVLRADGITVRTFVSSELCKPSAKSKTAAAAKAATDASKPVPQASEKRNDSHSTHGADRDRSAGPALSDEHRRTWQWPTNPDYTDREYQLEIVAVALFHNTLVSLPTGMGKTFIAAVVMHNFFRWFPTGQIVFLAPTRPLVTQQIDACYKIVGMPAHETAHMQGCVKSSDRQEFWRSKRVFYCTPQTFVNDLKSKRAQARRVVLVVFDEAHRATKNHSYVQCIKELDEQGGRYRVLALSATPGSDLNQVNDVIQNLHVSRIEVRTHDDASVKKYLKETTIDKITVPVSEIIEKLREMFLKVMDRPARTLITAGALPKMATARMNTLWLLKTRQEFVAARELAGTKVNTMPLEAYNYLLGNFTLLLNFVPALRELTTHGTSSFRSTLERVEAMAAQKSASRARKEIVKSDEWHAIQRELATLALANAHVQRHPKLIKLQEVLEEHFERKSAAGVQSRAIIFTQTRTSVDEILRFFHDMYGSGAVVRITDTGAQVTSDNKHESPPVIRAAPFVGQSQTAKVSETELEEAGEDDEDAAAAREDEECIMATALLDVSDNEVEKIEDTLKEKKKSAHINHAAQGQTQKEQVATLQAFKKGVINTLVATCIGEEGLDIGEVGVIVMYDAVKSPIRTIQRLGRTGRKNAGECKCLVTEAESKKFEDAFRQYRKIAYALKQSMAQGTVFTFYAEPTPPLIHTAADDVDAEVEDANPNDDTFVASLLSGVHVRLPTGTILPRIERTTSLRVDGDLRASQVAGLAPKRTAAKPVAASASIKHMLERASSIASANNNSTSASSKFDETQPDVPPAWLHAEHAKASTHSSRSTKWMSAKRNANASVTSTIAPVSALPEAMMSAASNKHSAASCLEKLHAPATINNPSTVAAKTNKHTIPEINLIEDSTAIHKPKSTLRPQIPTTTTATAVDISPATVRAFLTRLRSSRGIEHFKALTTNELAAQFYSTCAKRAASDDEQRKALKRVIKQQAMLMLDEEAGHSSDNDAAVITIPHDRVIADAATETHADYDSQPVPRGATLKRLRKQAMEDNSKPQQHAHKQAQQQPAKRPRVSEQQRRALRDRYLDLEAGVDHGRLDSQASVDSQGAVLPGRGAKDDMWRTAEGRHEEEEGEDGYDLQDSFINDAGETQASLNSSSSSNTSSSSSSSNSDDSSSDSGDDIALTAADPESLGRIAGRGAKAMPVVARLMQAIQRGEHIDDADESLIGSEIEDSLLQQQESTQDMGSMSASTQEEPAEGDTHDATHVKRGPAEVECDVCGVSAVRTVMFRCNICCNPSFYLCGACYPKRQILHSVDLGVASHTFTCIFDPDGIMDSAMRPMNDTAKQQMRSPTIRHFPLSRPPPPNPSITSPQPPPQQQQRPQTRPVAAEMKSPVNRYASSAKPPALPASIPAPSSRLQLTTNTESLPTAALTNSRVVHPVVDAQRHSAGLMFGKRVQAPPAPASAISATAAPLPLSTSATASVPSSSVIDSARDSRMLHSPPPSNPTIVIDTQLRNEIERKRQEALARRRERQAAGAAMQPIKVGM